MIVPPKVELRILRLKFDTFVSFSHTIVSKIQFELPFLIIEFCLGYIRVNKNLKVDSSSDWIAFLHFSKFILFGKQKAEVKLRHPISINFFNIAWTKIAPKSFG